ncbi:MAG TPA: hypothetical protein PLF13_00390 [candidate division Zixibacteria bacterium]|nr:hypothetical protein [candidate division Zixibacteria bacterium]
MFKKMLMILMVLVLPVMAFGTTDDGKPVKVITDADIIHYNYWSADTVYNLSGFCYVEDGEILIIEPGTVIKGNPGQAENATALIVARGGRIYAEGTECNPIIFTSIDDDVDEFDDIPLNDLGRGLWGGLIILGRAILPGTDLSANPQVIREGQIEGIPETEVRGAYGGTDDEDNSGVLRYVSIRHGGSEIGEANEINGLTMGAVGSGTTISHIEVFFNLDDGYEWFGGTVSCDHLVAAFVGDDCFDWDEGFRGTGQFWFAIHGSDVGDRGGEHDGTYGSELSTCPHTSGVVSNATYIGRGAAQTGTQRCFELRENMSGAYYNSIFTDHGTYGLNVEDNAAGSTLDNLKNGNLKLYNNIWYGFGNGNTSLDIAHSVNSVDSIVFHSYDPSNYWNAGGVSPFSGAHDNHNYLSTTDVVAATGSRTNDGSLDPRADNDASWFYNDGTDAWSWTNPFDADNYVGYHPEVTDPSGCIDYSNYKDFEEVDYAGAFDPNASETWAHQWTALDQYGYLFSAQTADCDCATDFDGAKPEVVVTDADIDGFTYFSSDIVWNLDGFVYVEDGDTLMIEPGTIVKGNPGQAENATALIVARGGRILAIGDECCPIIFTSIDDIVDDPNDIPFSDLGRGLWGGVILLGYAVLPGTDLTAVPQVIREGQIEGIPETEARGAYGGTDDEDNSGVLRYVSIRHGGSEIGEANEINGLTMGAVGSGTKISHVEVFMNLDDGYEWFGGTVSPDHLIAAFVGDDCFDWDEGFRGTGQFWFAIHDHEVGDRGGEHDGTYGSELSTCPHTSAVVSNATYIGRGAEQTGTQRCFELRENMSGAYYNSIFTEHGTYGLNVEDNAAGSTLDNLKNGNLKMYNNIWYGFGNGNSSLDISHNVNAVDSILFHNFDPSNYWNAGSASPFSGAYDNHNYLSTIDVINNSGTRTNDNSLDPRATNFDSLFLNDGSAPWSWTNPFNTDNFIGYHPEITDPSGCIDYSNYKDFEQVDYAGAFDPNVSMDECWAAGWSFLSCGDFLGDNPFNGGGCCQIVGDINHSGAGPDISDLVYLVTYMFSGGPAPDCIEEADINGSGAGPDISDLVYLVTYMFSGGPAPADCL